VKIGYLLDTHVGAYGRDTPPREEVADAMQSLLREGVTAEEAGFDGVFVPERHMRPETLWPDPFLLMAALAARTNRIDIGTYTSVITLYDPMHVAEMTAIIDNLSRGRLVFSASMGYHPDYFQMFGLNRKQRVSRFDEGLEVLLRAWSGERFSFAGKRFAYEDVHLTPPPYRQPRPKLWIGSQSDVGLVRAGQFSDGLAGYPLPLPPERWRSMVNTYREAADAAGNDNTVVVMREACIAGSRAEAERIGGAAMLEEFRFAFRWGGFLDHQDFQSIDDITLDKLRPHVVMGDVSDCCESVLRLEEELGMDYLIVRLRFPLGPDFGTVLESIRAFGEVVRAVEASTSTRKETM
jgi:alkanesulfonate monooxygenase SsuD/methylene tetrahydromethanopterin reductase-like flavin-dependent oxidoreductase (luciferase family)